MEHVLIIESKQNNKHFRKIPKPYNFLWYRTFWHNKQLQQHLQPQRFILARDAGYFPVLSRDW